MRRYPPPAVGDLLVLEPEANERSLVNDFPLGEQLRFQPRRRLDGCPNLGADTEIKRLLIREPPGQFRAGRIAQLAALRGQAAISFLRQFPGVARVAGETKAKRIKGVVVGLLFVGGVGQDSMNLQLRNTEGGERKKRPNVNHGNFKMNASYQELDIAQAATLADVASCINHYRMFTPGLYVCIHVPVRINESTRIIPGLIAQVNSGKFKQCDPGDYHCFSGPPNFVFDVFRQEQREDYESRRKLFEQSGVIEYVVWFNSDKLPIWNRLLGGKYHEIQEDQDGLIKSTSLPGLWIPVKALAERDCWSAMAKISHGITRREHHDFMATIWRK
jgi:hypothetical protein